MKKRQLEELKEPLCQYFLDNTNLKSNSVSYGLTLDHTMNTEKASIAASGFMLSSLILSHQNKRITTNKLLEIVRGTLKTFKNITKYHGFFPHFIDMTTGQRFKKCEYSTIDTALLMAGLIALDSYMEDFCFDEEIHQSIIELLTTVDFIHFVDKENKYLRMAYNPDIDGDYVTEDSGFIYQWHMFAEQLLMYPMIAGLIDDEHLSKTLYNSFERNKALINQENLIYPPHNTLFIYHMPLCFLNLHEITDKSGTSWEQNARLGTISHIKQCEKLSSEYETFQNGYFGMNASDSKKGYRVYGSIPNDENKNDTDGTIAPYSIIGSIPYYDKAMPLITRMKEIPNLYQKYGFVDAFQIENKTLWISKKYISIDKGIELLSVEQVLTDTVRKHFMNHDIIKKGLQILEFKEHREKV